MSAASERVSSSGRITEDARYELEGVGGMLDGGGVGEGVGAAETKGVGVGYQYMTGLSDDPVALTVVGEPAHAAAVAMTSNKAPSSFNVPNTSTD